MIKFYLLILISAEVYFSKATGESGICSWYGAEGEIPPGWPTASGEGFDRFEMSAAHKTLPFGTIIRVKNEKNGKTVDVRINDRGPFIPGRIVDLTFASFGIIENRDVGLVRDCSFHIVGEEEHDKIYSNSNSNSNSNSYNILSNQNQNDNIDYFDEKINNPISNILFRQNKNQNQNSNLNLNPNEDYFDEESNHLIAYN